LGSGVSGILALVLGSQVRKYIATDQPYVLKLLRQNIVENLDVVFPQSKKGGKSKKGKKDGVSSSIDDRIVVEELDWEETDTSRLHPVDLVLAADCIYNEALIEPFNETCAAICRLRGADERPTVCLIAQQIRSPDVFEAWLKSFQRSFYVWRVPGEMLSKELGDGSGFVIYAGIVR
jgi:hypothetical protein